MVINIVNTIKLILILVLVPYAVLQLIHLITNLQ
jgi:hypothetical protein